VLDAEDGAEELSLVGLLQLFELLFAFFLERLAESGDEIFEFSPIPRSFIAALFGHWNYPSSPEIRTANFKI
jgi:hypothetical protein